MGLSLRREWPSVGVALLVHLAAFATVVKSGGTQIAVSPAPAPAEADVDTTFEISTLPDGPTLDGRSTRSSLQVAGTSTSLLAKASHGRTDPRTESIPAPAAIEALRPMTDGTASPTPETGTTSDPAWTFDPRGSVDVTSPGFVAQALQNGADKADPTRATGASATGGLTEGLAARDVALGLGQGGPVLSALEDAARRVGGPVDGFATFDVGIDTSGHVSVSVTNVSSAYDSWARVASVAVASVDTRRIHIPPGHRGWRVAVRVEAKEQFPNGLRPRELGTHVTTTGAKIAKDSMVMESVPSVTVATTGKVCGVGLTVSILGPGIVGGCNPENAGMPAVRIVSGHVIDEGPL